MAYQVFLSHAAADREAATELKTEIERFDVLVYMYEHDFQPGANLPAKLIAAIHASDALVVLLTRQGGSRPAVNQEIGVAIGTGKLVVPLVEDGVDLEPYTLLQGREYVPFDPETREVPRKAVADYLERLRRKKVKTQLWTGGILAALLLWASGSE